MGENSVNKRLMQFLKIQGISARRFELSIGASNGYAKTITRGVSAERLRSISKEYPTLNIDWLLTGEGSMLKDTPLVSQTNVNGSNTANVGTQGREVSELEAKLREKDLEIVHLQSQLQDAKEWNLKLFELLKSTQK